MPLKAVTWFAQAAKWLALGLVEIYQRVLSPASRMLLGPLVGTTGRRCRYYPTCSNYAHEAVSRYGAFRGGYLALRRILRCNPWSAGGYDPVK